MYLLAYFTALNVFADPKVINTATTVIESGSSYTGGSGYAALHVSASGAYYHGEIGNNVRITTNDGLESIIPHEGLYAAGSGTLLVTGTGVSVRSTSNAASVAGGYLDLGRGTELATQFMTIALNTGTIVGVDTKATSQQSGGIRVVNGNDSYLHLVNPNIQVENTVIAIAGSRTAGGDTVHIEGGSIISTAGELIRSGSNSDGIMMNSGTVIIKNTKVSLGSDNLLVSSGSTSVHLIAEDTDLPGNIIGSDTAIIDVTLSGPGSSITGDVFQNDAAVVTVTLNSGATGSGGYTGGNLITGGDSTWTFDKDSRGNYGENNGTWNIGDYNVTFDNLDHNGTVTISVNSDTGEGGSITVIDTADGDGTIHINTTGNGQADPNQVLPNIVSGDGTEHWQWDPIDWGIDTIIKDGDHFIKSGVSPAGAVLNSSVAIQQAMWFAQQNSLLKRMGELRYGARASRPPAGGTPALHELIENLWLRSYGQQLNVGSQVSGKAYEQLIYGVDLGTDHKFTLSADSDLYLGVYAGYGRSDLDYRTPGTDGEINSYYGGLYATWLHASGFYIDATFKAASVNNDLKAPYSGSQITANYSDVNLGGSLEFGHKFTFADDWFIEPQFQVNYLHILAENYQAGPMTISAQDLDALQLRIGSLFGRTINLTNGGALQPYLKISGVETISSGGTLRNGYQSTRANTDGARAELGAGLIWQLDTNNQLHLDYEASFGDKYDKPWGLSAGYRHQF